MVALQRSDMHAAAKIDTDLRCRAIALARSFQGTRILSNPGDEAKLGEEFSACALRLVYAKRRDRSCQPLQLVESCARVTLI